MVQVPWKLEFRAESSQASDDAITHPPDWKCMAARSWPAISRHSGLSRYCQPLLRFLSTGESTAISGNCSRAAWRQYFAASSLRGRIEEFLIRCPFFGELLLKLLFRDNAFLDYELCDSVHHRKSRYHKLLQAHCLVSVNLRHRFTP